MLQYSINDKKYKRDFYFLVSLLIVRDWHKIRGINRIVS